jgi:hypothetical protein
MKRKPKIILLLLFVAFTATSFIKQDTQNIVESVTESIKNGNSSELAKFFNTTVELEILDDQNIYSKAQSELLLKDFFNRNKPTSFRIIHQGTKANTSYAIGSLQTTTSNFRVSIFMKFDNDKTLIHQFRIERSE